MWCRSFCAGVLLLLVWGLPVRGEERLWVEARIQGQPTRLIFDTGADRLILFPWGAQRLGLTVTPPPREPAPCQGQAAVGHTEPCDITLWQNTLTAPLPVLELPAYLHMNADGAIGWGPLRHNVLRLDAIALAASFLPDVPVQAQSWLQLRVPTNSGFLFLRTPELDRTNAVVLVDTGFSGGVALEPGLWRQWKLQHATQPSTVDSYFMPGAGLVVKEEMWASRILLGPLLLTDVPVTEANSAQVALGGVGYQASIGLAALKRLDLLVDGTKGRAYVRLRHRPAAAYDQNRLGAVFVPGAAGKDPLIAHVVDHSPAFEAGIRNGDTLLSVDKLDVTKWRTSSGILPLARFWARPAGTRLHLTLQRRGKLFSTTAVLREILSGNQKSAQNKT